MKKGSKYITLAEQADRDACISIADELLEKIKNAAECLVLAADNTSATVGVTRGYYPLDFGGTNPLEAPPEQGGYFIVYEVSIYDKAYDGVNEAIDNKKGFAFEFFCHVTEKNSTYRLEVWENELDELRSDLERAAEFIREKGTDALFERLFSESEVKPSPFVRFILNTPKGSAI